MQFEYQELENADYAIPIPGRLFDYQYMTGYFEHQVKELAEEHEAQYKAHGDLSVGAEFTSRPLFGLIKQDYPDESEEDKKLAQWPRFVKHVRRLNEKAAEGEEYRILLLWRHGQSPHNRLCEIIGHEKWQAWACLENTNQSKESFIDPDTGLDLSKQDICLKNPSLTETGIAQARIGGEKWVEYELPVPDVVYTSPIRRTIQTAFGMLHKIFENAKSVHMTVVEYLRENMGNHRPHHRHSQAWLLRAFGHDKAIGWGYTRGSLTEEQLAKAEAEAATGDRKWTIGFEEGFDPSEDDPLVRESREPVPFIARRAGAVLNQVFSVGSPTDKTLAEDQKHMVVALSSHSLTVLAFQKVFLFPKKWKPFPAEMVPMLIKATKIVGDGGDTGRDRAWDENDSDA